MCRTAEIHQIVSKGLSRVYIVQTIMGIETSQNSIETQLETRQIDRQIHGVRDFLLTLSIEIITCKSRHINCYLHRDSASSSVVLDMPRRNFNSPALTRPPASSPLPPHPIAGPPETKKVMSSLMKYQICFQHCIMCGGRGVQLVRSYDVFFSHLKL